MIASTTPALLAEVAARLPVNGRERAKALAIYQQDLATDDVDAPSAEELEAMSPVDFLRLLGVHRLRWEARIEPGIVAMLTAASRPRRLVSAAWLKEEEFGF
jgi:hypothetical protein